MDPKYIYIFRSRDGFYKIGISNNVESRLSSIRTSNHDDVEIVIARKIDDAFGFEQELHKRYEHRISRKSGEWFKLNSDEVIDVCIEINQAEGEKPKIVDKLLEKSILKYSEDHSEIKNELQLIRKQLTSNQNLKPDRDMLFQSSSDIEAVKKIEVKRKDDDLTKEAEKIVRIEGKASASFLQRKLSIGYARAARLLDKLQENGVVGPQNGAMPRYIIPTAKNEFHYRNIVVTET